MSTREPDPVGNGRTRIRDRRKVSVLHLGSPTGLYGAERWILALVRHLPATEVRSVVGVIMDDPDQAESELCRIAAGLGIATVEFESLGRLSFSAVSDIRAYIVENNIDILHTHWYKTDLIGRLAVRGTNCRILTTPHGWSSDAGFKLQAYELLDRIAFSFIDAVAPLSPAIHTELMRFPWLRKKLTLIENGVDLAEIAESNCGSIEESRSFRIGYIGQLIPRKRIEILIEAFAALKVPSKRLTIIGQGSERARLEAMANSLIDGDTVEFLGFREDRLQLLRSFDVFVLPSSLEGIPRCLLEAMACNIPVIATNIPGTRELVIPGETGLLFNDGDSRQLTDHLARLANDASLRESLTRRASELVVNRFSATRMANEYSELYARLAFGISDEDSSRIAAPPR